MRRSTLARALALGLLAVPCVFLAGCGGGSASVSGTVTFDNAPLDDGTITFVPEKSGGKSVGEKIVGGKYAIPADRGLAAGKYKVEITATRKPDARKGEKVDPDITPQGAQILPEKYNKQTTLTAELKSGSNDGVDFKLTR